MPVAEGRLDIAASQEAVFDLAQDYDRRLEWDPFLRQIRFLDADATANVGTRVWVRARNGLSMEVTYIVFDRPRTVAMKMVDGPRMFSRFAGTWRFEKKAERLTEVTFRYNFETAWSSLRPVLNPVIRSILTRDIRLRLEGLARGCDAACS